MSEVPLRKMTIPLRDEEGLCIQPHDVGPDRELVEQHHRQTAAFHGDYADSLCGRAVTFDPKGNYLCGDCNQVDGNKCLLVGVPKLDPKASSCRHFERKFAGDPEQKLLAISMHLAAFGTDAAGKGFGCHRCPYQEKAHAPDSVGRTLYCKIWECRVEENACCAVNGRKTLPIPSDWNQDLDADDAWEEDKETFAIPPRRR